MHSIRSGKSLFGAHTWGVFDLIDQFEPGLIVDAGAAAGYVSKYLLNKSPMSHAIGFEPNPSNWPHIEKTLDAASATIVKAALADKPGSAQFFVGKSEAQGWATSLSGYSSIGHIIDERVSRPADQTISVPVTTVDEHVHERILFFKIDVQGGELNVLKGASRAFDRGVDLLYIEFDGEREMLDFLFERDYLVFDHQYLLVPQVKNGPDLSSWDIVKDITLSTGHNSHYGWPKEMPSDPGAYCNFFHSEAKKIGQVYTDIVAIRKDLADEKGWA